MKRVFALLLVLSILSAGLWWYFCCLACSAKSDQVTFSKGCVIERNGNGVFPILASFEDGTSLPLAGPFPPFEESKEQALFVRNAAFRVEAIKYDLVGYRAKMESLLSERKQLFGEDAILPGVRGLVGEGDKVEFLMVTRITTEDGDWELAGYLEEFGCKRVSERTGLE